MDNRGFRNEEGHPPAYGDVERSGATKKPSGMRKFSSRTKSQLQENKYTSSFCPPKGEAATTLTLILTIITVFVAARSVLGPIADIGGTIFALLILILLALLGGKLLELLSFLIRKYCNVDIRFPPLLGMLIVGIILKNVPYNFGQFGRAECTRDHHNSSFVDSIHDLDDPNEQISFRKRSVSDDEIMEGIFEPEEFVLDRVIRSVAAHEHDEPEKAGNDSDCHERYIGHDLDPVISRTLRQICLTVILLMAGLELDPVQLSRLSGMVVRATFIPCLTEAVAVAIFSNLLLNLPWTVGFMLGFILAAVSPAVIIPSLMSLSGRGYGVEKGIPTLVIAACAADDVVAISGFGIFMGITFSSGAPLWKLILHGPIEVVIGVLFGGFWGFLAQWIPNKEHHHVAFFRYKVQMKETEILTQSTLQVAGSVRRRSDCSVRSSSHPLRRSRRTGHHHHGLRGRDAVEGRRLGGSQPRHQNFPEDVDHPSTRYLCPHWNRDPSGQDRPHHPGLFSAGSGVSSHHPDVRHLCCSHGRRAQREREDLHGFRLAAQGHCPSCSGPNFPQQGFAVRR